MKIKSTIQISIIFLIMSYSQPVKSQTEFGVFADCQYCDCETRNTRFYKNSPDKLNECITFFNQNENIEFVVGLGDLIDRNLSSYETLIPILNQSKNEIFHVIGNHDLEVNNEFLEKVPEKLNLSKTWYSFVKNSWRFIFLNGNDITFHSNNPEIVNQAKKIVSKMKNQNKPNSFDWNGGIGDEQLVWMESQLEEAQTKNQKVILFCHYPLLPLEAHTLWNSEEVLAILQKYKCVKCWMNGHNHAGNYMLWEGIHFLNLTGMVETENTNSFAIVKIENNNIIINGFGNEPDRTLQIY
ncbi:phosphoesterase [Maribellus comscasis]|uniref:Phosphoesterase n=1 Tax=Maribellus comscasis TaxID=2681766 RepID=A0A6I6K518_9BACT|nr:metallophosphoesterase [Maribellus comscasis]QGY46713.1 phosphoesterase [Maribellus comscasis]